jgi:carboxymethylenebutenolidase
MKRKVHMRKILFLLFTVMAAAAAQQADPCCSATPTEEFAAFGKDMAFVALHEAPAPFEFRSSGGEMKSIKTADRVDALIYEARSDQPTNNYIFVFHEWWGLNDYIKQEAERIRRDIGNVNVIAVDLYDGKIAATPDSARVYVGQVKEERARTIIQGVIDYAGKKAKVTTLGWCFGGSWSMQTALMLGKQAVGCVIYYGMPEKDPKKLRTLNCDVLGIFAGQDGYITPAVVEEFQKSMKTAGKKTEVKMFDAVHAFANPSNPNHDKSMAAEAHVAVVSYIKKKFGL